MMYILYTDARTSHVSVDLRDRHKYMPPPPLRQAPSGATFRGWRSTHKLGVNSDVVGSESVRNCRNCRWLWVTCLSYIISKS